MAKAMHKIFDNSYLKSVPLIYLFLFILSVVYSDAYAKGANQNNPSLKGKDITFTAEEVSHDKKLGVIKASGNVEVFNNEQVLLADRISYNQRHDMLIATGHVSLLEPSGHVLFSEYMELSGDFKSGIIKNLKVRLSDNARMAASNARLKNGNQTVMKNAVYSPCTSCSTVPEQLPLWQVKAKKVVHDQKEQQLEYFDAWLELFGAPIFYTPYFWHPDPTVKRKSGFLTPRTGGSSFLGTTITTPYFYAISRSKDLTITPTITTKERVIMEGEYREHFPNGKLESRNSLTFNSNNNIRGHIDSTGRYDINEKFRWGFDANRSTDDTYLRLYGLPSSRSLTTKTYIEGFSRRNYLTAEAYAFQGTAIQDDPGLTPIVLPLVEYSRKSAIGKSGESTGFNASAIAMTRSEANDTRRISIDGNWQLPHIGKSGDFTTFSIKTRADLYHVNNLVRMGEQKFSGFTGRIHPQAKVDWRLPLSRQHGNISQTFEPLASIIISPYGGNTSKIPNEDSKDLEFDDTNLFSDNVFTGYDRVVGGPRLKYGLKWGLFGSKGGHTTIFTGQSFRAKEDNTFAAGSGLEGRLSDFVGRINVSPGNYLDFMFHTRLDKDNYSAKRNEFQLTAGPPALRLSTNYVFFESTSDADFSGREEISGNISAKLDRFWRSDLAGRYDFKDDGDLRNIAVNLTYECECFTFSTSFNRQFYSDRDLRPNDTIMLRISFKTLGDIRTGLSNSSD